MHLTLKSHSTTAILKSKWMERLTEGVTNNLPALNYFSN